MPSNLCYRVTVWLCIYVQSQRDVIRTAPFIQILIAYPSRSFFFQVEDINSLFHQFELEKEADISSFHSIYTRISQNLARPFKKIISHLIKVVAELPPSKDATLAPGCCWPPGKKPQWKKGFLATDFMPNYETSCDTLWMLPEQGWQLWWKATLVKLGHQLINDF